jgi:MFS family permease
VLAAAVAQIIGIPLFGALSDRFGRRPVLIFGAVSAIVWGFVFFALVDTAVPSLIMLASFVGMFLHAAMWGPLASFLPEMFETRVRCTGASLGFQLAGVFGGAPAPVIATQLMAGFDSPWPVAIYLAASLALVVVSVLAARETVGVDLRSVDADSDGMVAVRPAAVRGA